MKLRTKALVIAATAASIATPAWAHPGHPPISPPTVSFTTGKAIPFEFFRDQRIFLQGSVNGRSTPMMLDSGAGPTVIDKDFAEKIGLPAGFPMQVQGASGTENGQLVPGVSVTAGTLRLENETVLVMDLSTVARSIGRPMPAILGQDAFKAGVVTIDFARRAILFSDRSSFVPPPGSLRVPLIDAGMVRRIKISVAGLPSVDADFDLGSGGTVILGNGYWTQQPKLAGLGYAQGQIGGLSEMKSARRVTLPTVQLGDRSFERVPATLNEDPQMLPRDGANVGTEMFKPFVTAIDFAGNALYLSGPKSVRNLARERAGVRSELDGDHLNVIYVSPEGPAAVAGLRAGDSIIAVDGRRVDRDYYAQSEWSFGPAGRAVTLLRSNGTTITVKLADYY